MTDDQAITVEMMSNDPEEPESPKKQPADILSNKSSVNMGDGEKSELGLF